MVPFRKAPERISTSGYGPNGSASNCRIVTCGIDDECFITKSSRVHKQLGKVKNPSTMLSHRAILRLPHTAAPFIRALSSKFETAVLAPQAPNHPTPWSTNQQQRPVAGHNPRLEQTVMELQPNPLSAMELIAREPIRFVHGRKAVCDGGVYTISSERVRF